MLMVSLEAMMKSILVRCLTLGNPDKYRSGEMSGFATS